MLPAPSQVPLLSIRDSRHVHERAQAPGLAGHARPSSAFFCSQQDCNLSRELPQPRASALLIGGALAGGLAIRHVASSKRSRQCHRYPFGCSQVVTSAGKPLSMRLAVPAGSAEEAESSAATVKRRLSTTVPEDCDVVVIGAGLGGLASAAALAKSGRRVVVLEAHTEVGGCAHSFTRRSPSGGEYIFDSGPSIVTEMGLQNPLRQAMDYVGASKYVEWIHYDGWGMLTPEGPWKLCLGPEDFRNNVLPLYNVPASEFDAVAEACAPLAQTGYSIPGVVLRDDDWQLLPLVLKFPGGVIPALRDAAALSEPFSVVLEKLEAEGKLRRDSWLWAWMDALAFSLSGLDCSGTTTAAMAFTMEELHKPRSRGLAYPVGGMGVVVEALAKAVEDHGGLIRTGTKVAEVLLEEEIGGSSSSSAGSSSSSSKSARRRAVGVRYGKKGDMMLRASENVVCNAAVWDAAGLVQGESEPLDQLRSDWRSTPMTRSYLHLHVGLDASGLDLASLQPHYTHMDNWENVTEEMNMVAISNPCLLDPSLAPEGKLTLHLYCAGNEAFEPWQAKLQEGGRSAYEAMKEERAARLWRALELVIPDARSRAEVALVGSPLTHRRYLRREAGTYGAAPVFGRFGPGKLPFRTASDARSSSGGAVEGLLLCGDSTFPGIGVPAAVISGLSAAHTSMSVWEHLGLLGRAGY